MSTRPQQESRLVGPLAVDRTLVQERFLQLENELMDVGGSNPLTSAEEDQVRACARLV